MYNEINGERFGEAVTWGRNENTLQAHIVYVLVGVQVTVMIPEGKEKGVHIEFVKCPLQTLFGSWYKGIYLLLLLCVIVLW